MAFLGLSFIAIAAREEYDHTMFQNAVNGSAFVQTLAQRHLKAHTKNSIVHSLGKQGIFKKQRRSRPLKSRAPCQCQPDSPDWQRPSPRPPRCLFIDLGAADGNSFMHFLQGGYGAVKGCPSSGSYEALLVEANPFFDKPLRKLMGARPSKKSTGYVRTLLSTAAYMCEGTVNFYLDTVDTQNNFWGSSMSPNTRDVQRSGKKKVSVPTINVARLLIENALPEDYVIVKADIEGSEWDIVPCLARSPAAQLIDALYVEKHPREWSLLGMDESTYQDAMSVLEQKGIFAPVYDSPS